jgi:AbrB family looped-hinge helix DNA binding protein
MLRSTHLPEPAMSTVNLSSKGQIALPVELRNRLGLAAGSRLEITEEAGGLLLRPVHTIAPVSLEGLAGMVKAAATGKQRSLDDFDVAALLARRGRSQP